MKFFKPLLFIGCIFAGVLTSDAASLSVALTNNQPVMVSTNRASVYSIDVAAGAGVAVPVIVDFYDNDQIAAPYYGTNYQVGSYTIRTTYPTNIVSFFVGNNGYTNWYTNVGLSSVTVTNGGPGLAVSPKMFSASVAPGTVVTYGVDILFARGLVAVANTNASIAISYRSGM